MRKMKLWMMAAILVCGTSVFTACSDSNDNPAQEQAKKNRKEFVEHTRTTLKNLAENLNFGSWEAANNLNKYFNEYVLNNPEFEKSVLTAFMEKTLLSIKPVEEGSEMAKMGVKMYATVDLTEFNYRFKMNDEKTAFDIEEADDFEVIVSAFNPETSAVEPSMLKLTLKAGGSQAFKALVMAKSTEGLAFVVVVPSEFQFAISDKFSGTWKDGFTGSFKNEVTTADGAEFINLGRDAWAVSGTVSSYMQAVPTQQVKPDETTVSFLVSDNPTTKEIKREFSFVQNGRNMLALSAVGRDELGLMPFSPAPDLGELPDVAGVPEVTDKPDINAPELPDMDGDGQPDERPTSSSADSQLLNLMNILLGGKSFEKVSFTLIDDLTTTLSIGDCQKVLQLQTEMADARRSYADQKTIDGYTQQLNELVKAEIVCKGVNQQIPMRLVTTKFGVDWWAMPAFNFSDENGYVSFVDLLDPESVEYGINIIDHAAEPMKESIVVVRQLLQYLQTLVSGQQQSE